VITLSDPAYFRLCSPTIRVAIGTQVVGRRLHPRQQRLSGQRADTGTLQRLDFLALSSNLGAHALDFSAGIRGGMPDASPDATRKCLLSVSGNGEQDMIWMLKFANDGV